MKKTLLTISMLFALTTLSAQYISSSNLPIVIINTDNGATIPDEPKIGATMKILYINDTTTNYLSNQNDSAYLNYIGRIGIECRGSTSQGHNKKPYGFETRMADDVTNNNVSLLGLPAENDWVLNPMNDEPSYIRDNLSYILAAQLGDYAPRPKYCEVIVNGDYRGLYFLTEKIKIDAHRVDILEMDSADNAAPNVTGGYIIKADKLTGGDVPAWSTTAYDYWQDVDYIYHAPKPEEITLDQGDYIRSYFETTSPPLSTTSLWASFRPTATSIRRAPSSTRTATESSVPVPSGISTWLTVTTSAPWGARASTCCSSPTATTPVPTSGTSSTRTTCSAVTCSTAGRTSPTKGRRCTRATFPT